MCVERCGSQIDLANGLEVTVRQAGRAQNLQNHIGLASGVGVAILGVLTRQLLLQRSISACDVRVRPQIVAYRQVIAKGKTVARAELEMMTRERRRRVERLATGDAEVSLMRVAEGRETLDPNRYVSHRRHDDRHIDDRLRGETGDGSAADMLDGRCDIRQRRPDSIAQPLECRHPARVVIDDDERTHQRVDCCLDGTRRRNSANQLMVTRIAVGDWPSSTGRIIRNRPVIEREWHQLLRVPEGRLYGAVDCSASDWSALLPHDCAQKPKLRQFRPERACRPIASTIRRMASSSRRNTEYSESRVLPIRRTRRGRPGTAAATWPDPAGHR